MASEEFMDEIIESEIEQLKAEKESYYHDYRMKFDVETKKLHTEIVALKSELHELKAKYDFQHLVKENDRLKAENEKLKSEFNEIWTPAFGELKAEITKLREQIKDYEQALKTIENKDTDSNNERALCDSVNLAREVLKKWGGM